MHFGKQHQKTNLDMGPNVRPFVTSEPAVPDRGRCYQLAKQVNKKTE